jgi:histidinol-phosphatase (PHP family)
MVARYRELGGQRVTVGSDAHRADAFAWALDDGYAAAVDAGFDNLAFRRGGPPVDVPIPTAPNAVAGRSL